MRGIVLLSIALLLSSCGMIQRERLKSEVSDIKQQMVTAADAYRTAIKDPALDPIRHKVQLIREQTDGPPPFEIISNNSFPSDADRPAIARWASIRDDYLKQSSAIKYVPNSANGLQRTYIQGDRAFTERASGETSKLIVALYQGKISYSEFGQKRYEIGQSADEAERQYREAALIADQKRQIEAQRAASEQFASNLVAWSAYMQTVNARTPAVSMTNCVPFGAQISCTTFNQ